MNKPSPSNATRIVRFAGRDFIRYASDHVRDVLSGLHFHRERDKGRQSYGRDRRGYSWHDSGFVTGCYASTLQGVAEHMNRRDNRIAREMVNE